MRHTHLTYPLFPNLPYTILLPPPLQEIEEAKKKEAEAAAAKAKAEADAKAAADKSTSTEAEDVSMGGSAFQSTPTALHLKAFVLTSLFPTHTQPPTSLSAPPRTMTCKEAWKNTIEQINYHSKH